MMEHGNLFSLQNAVYKGEYTATHPTVRLFWEVFHEFPLEKKKQFLCKYLIAPLLNVHDTLMLTHKYLNGVHVCSCMTSHSALTKA